MEYESESMSQVYTKRTTLLWNWRKPRCTTAQKNTLQYLNKYLVSLYCFDRTEAIRIVGETIGTVGEILPPLRSIQAEDERLLCEAVFLGQKPSINSGLELYIVLIKPQCYT
jgi:hypothetical protein